tara:strand:- start:1713 stop:2090 length:378 start_codon:yes stop_codon:yes gene_type:complete
VRIGLTPLIDLVFILLIFLMLASNFDDRRALNITLPEPAGGRNEAGPAVLTVLLKTSGAIMVDGAATNLDRLTYTLESVAIDAQRRILVRPEAGVAVQRIVSVLDRLIAAGFRNTTLARGDGGGK